MSRHYLTEDIEQIRRYFPGARAVALRTPFDITPKPRRVVVDSFRAEPDLTVNWRRGLRWMS